MDIPSLLTEAEANSERVHGRTLVIEDPSRDIVETLGTVLDIDPFFFASHISFPLNGIDDEPPTVSVPPSRIRTQSFLSIDVHRVLSFPKSLRATKLLRGGNIPRKS
jgi:hypothetical protein